MIEKIKNNRVILLLLITGAVYFFLQFISPLIGPVLIAMLFVTIFGPLLKKMQGKLHLNRQIGAVLLLASAGLILVGLLCVLFLWIVGSLPGWAGGLEAFVEEIQALLHGACETIGRFVGVDGLYLENTILGGLDDSMNFPGQRTVPGFLSQSLEYVKYLGTLGGFLITFLIATVLMAKDYDDIMNQLLDKEECRVFLEVICGVIRYIATFVKAQVMIMTVIGVLAAVTLGVLGIRNGILWGILAGFLDALPFIGTGIVLMPMALFMIVQGSFGKAVICVILYVVCIFVRELLEPRLIGNRMGIPPIAVLVSLYAGIQLFGVGGIIKGPLGFILIYQTYLSIRKSEERKKSVRT